MDKLTTSRLNNFFDDFSKRVNKHWPLPEADDEEDDDRIAYRFVYIKTKEDLTDYLERFKNFYQPECQFSPRSFVSEEKIKNHIGQIKERLPNQEDYDCLFGEQKKSSKYYLKSVCSFLVLAFPITNELSADTVSKKETLNIEDELSTDSVLEKKTPDKNTKISGAIILDYYRDSKSILISSILVDPDLMSKNQKDLRDLIESLLVYKYKQKINSNQKGSDEVIIMPGGLSGFIRSVLLKKDRIDNLITGIYHEANDPTSEMSTTSDNIESREKVTEWRESAADVLDIFHYVRAKHIKFLYRKPAYESENDLFLLTFPELLPNNTNSLMVDIREVMFFIINYAYILLKEGDYEKYKIDKDNINNWLKNDSIKPLQGCKINGENLIRLNVNSLIKYRNSEYSNELYLNNIPRLERPNFSYKRAAVCFEIVIDEDYFDPIGIRHEDNVRPVSKNQLSWFGRIVETVKEEWKLGEELKPVPLNCVVYHSTETDLFAYKYQSNPPYFTKYFNLPSGNDVTIRLPSHFEFTSEGRQETYYVLPHSEEVDRLKTKSDNIHNIFYRELVMEVHLSYTYFLNSNIRIWHLALTPIEQKDSAEINNTIEQNEGISELDIIKLMKFFSGSQENESEEKKREILDNISFISKLKKKPSLELPSRKKLVLVWLLQIIIFTLYLPIRILKLPIKISGKIYNVLKVTYSSVIYDNNIYIIYFRKFFNNNILSFTTCVFILVIILLSIFYQISILALLAVFFNEISFACEKISESFMKTKLYKNINIIRIKFNYVFLNRDLKYNLAKIIQPASNEETIGNMSSKDKGISPIKLLQNLTGIEYVFRKDRQDDILLKPEDRVLSLKNIRSGIIEIDTGAFDEIEEDNLLTFNSKSFKKFYYDNIHELEKYNKEKIKEKSGVLSTERLSIFHQSLVKNQIRNEVKKSYLKLYNKEKDDSVSGALLESDDDDNLPKVLKDYANYVFKAYCGICLGIFDYDRMGLEEIDDTLMPLEESKTEQSFQALNRGVLSMFGYEEDVMNTFWKTLGLSPYLIIPSAVLAQNDSVSIDAERRLDSLLNDLREEKSNLSISELISNRHEIDDLLNDDILSNVFHYKTEKGIYKQGMESRGIDERIKTSKQKLEQLDKEIELKQKEREDVYQQRIQVIVTIVGLINFYTVIRDVFVDELADPNTDPTKTEKTDRAIHWNNIRPDEWLMDIINYKYFPIWLKDFLVNIWHWLKETSEINPIGLSHMTFFIIVTSTVFVLVLLKILDPSKSGKSKSWQNRKKRRRKLPKVVMPS